MFFAFVIAMVAFAALLCRFSQPTSPGRCRGRASILAVHARGERSSGPRHLWGNGGPEQEVGCGATDPVPLGGTECQSKACGGGLISGLIYRASGCERAGWARVPQAKL